MTTLGIGMTVDLDVVGRVQERGVDRSSLADHSLQKLRIASVPASDTMFAQNPDVAERGFRFSRNRWNDLFVGIIGSLEHHVDLAACKAGQRQVEVDVERANVVELKPKNLDVPPGIQRD